MYGTHLQSVTKFKTKIVIKLKTFTVEIKRKSVPEFKKKTKQFEYFINLN